MFLTSTVGISSESGIETARALYDRGKFSEALELIQKSGLNTASDYYNAGNCLFRLGKVGLAYAYYQKADALSPHHSDIRYNLSLSEEALKKNGSLQKNQSLWTGSFVPVARQIPEAYPDILLAITTLAIAGLAYRAKKAGQRFATTVVKANFLAAFTIWVLTAASIAAVTAANRVRLAAVVADVGVARSGPAETFTELFKLPAGADVELTGETREGWQQIRFSLGNVGWIMDKDLLAL